MLTSKQLDLLIFIDKELKSKGVCPSFDEMRQAVGLKSKSGIHILLNRLEERGFLGRLSHRARALTVLKMPDNFKLNTSGSSIPLLGKIAAGKPIEAVCAQGIEVDIPPSMLGRGHHYALEVEGDSMIDAGIFDGDTVIIEECTSLPVGAIGVALVDELEVTLKRIYKQDGQVILRSANSAYDDRVLPSSRVRVQGRLSGLLRSY